MSLVQLSRSEQLSPASLNLPYRKKRNYIHSTDIFAALTSLAESRFSADSYVASLVLRRQAHRQLRACFQAIPEAVGTFSIRWSEEKILGYLVETEEDVARRISYDESAAEAAVVIRPGAAQFVEPLPGYTAFEQLIVLLRAALGEEPRHIWLCQVNLTGPLLTTEPLAVSLRQTTLQRFFNFEIMQQGKPLGTACALCE